MESKLIFHHSRTLEHVCYDTVHPIKLSQLQPEPTQCLQKGSCPDDEWHDAKIWMEPAYEWLQSHCGFYPLFIAVGASPFALEMTGYHSQFWRENKKEIFDEQVLFSYSDLPAPVYFTDYDWWHLVLGGYHDNQSHQRIIQPSRYVEKMILKRSYGKSWWLRYADSKSGSAQAVVPSLSLPGADLVRCRNQKTRQRLIRMGFPAEQVVVERIRVQRWW